MKKIWTILAILLVIAYVISPIDLFPDVIPIFGYIDDAVLIGLLIYYLRNGRLPGFLSWIETAIFGNRNRQGDGGYNDFYDHHSSQQEPANHWELHTDPYSVLGVLKTATPEEIQAAYRNAVQKYHPDKVSHLGKEFQELAQKKFIEIQKAYDQLKTKKG